MDVAQILLSAQSANQQARTTAERVLKNAEEENFGNYLTTLADHLAGDENNAESRRLAGLIIKNTIYVRDLAVRQHLIDRWHRVPDEQKSHVRHSMLRALSARAPEARRAAAQCTAKLASMDVGRPGAWDTLISDLLKSAHSQEDHVKQAALEALGYICEEAGYGDVMEQVLASKSNEILTAVVQSMAYKGAPSSTEKSLALVRLAATVALNNTLEFAKSQFDVPAERKAIITTICEAAMAGDGQVRQAAFEGLVKVAENYYDKLHEYILDIYTLTEHAIRNDIEPVAMQAIEFWSTVAEEEVTINFDNESLGDTGSGHLRENRNFVSQALPSLCGPIFDSLKKQEDDPLEDSSWNTATAAGACVELLAQAAPDVILNLAKPFIETNIQDQANWRSREAAILAFGSILEGPPAEDVKILVREAINLLIETLMTDRNVAVKDTTAWSIAKVVQVDKEVTLSHLPALVECLRGSLINAENPELAAHLCYAIHNLAERFVDEHEMSHGSLTEYQENLVRSLIRTADRDDAGEANLRISAYESISMIFRAVSEDGVTFINDFLPVLLGKLQNAMGAVQRAFTDDEKNDMLEQLGLICGALTTATHRLKRDQLASHADRMMENYLQVFRIGGTSSVIEDTFLAVGALADGTEGEFNRYMSHFAPVLQQALGNLAHHQMVGIAVGVVTELSRALGKDLIPYADNIAVLLLEALRSTTLDRAIKPAIVTCFGDIAMATKGYFEKYLSQVMECMKQAAQSSLQMDVPVDDFDTIDWVHMLREALLEAITGIVGGLKDEGKQELLMPQLDWIMNFCELMIERESQQGGLITEDILRPIMALMGDLGDGIPQFKEVARRKSWIQLIVDRGQKSTDERTREIASWALNSIFQ